MTVWHALYQLVIGPLELLFEVIFSLVSHVVSNPGLVIIFLSLAMNFLVLPLYRRADAMQAEQRDQTIRMKPWVDHIKKTFKGDERFMMLSTYYRQVGYKQTDVLKGSVSLLLEVPFFIAAYHFLSNLSLLQGVSFGPIGDLGAPDGLIRIGGLAINLLPILMTAINVAAAAIYMKGFPLRSKIQMYGMAAVFLVLLYNSPAGLVFYWTLNNLFSLAKNIFYKLKNPKRVFLYLLSGVGAVAFFALLIFHPLGTGRRSRLLLFAVLLLQLPLAIELITGFIRRKRDELGVPQTVRAPMTKEDGRGFFYGCLLLALVTGLLIPSAILHASPQEFINTQNGQSPLWYIAESMLLATGTFVIWCGIFYRLAGTSGKRVMNLGAWIVSVCSVVNYLFFGNGHGNLSEMLQYDSFVSASRLETWINALVLLALAAILYLIWKKKIRIVRFIALTLCLATFGLSMRNVIGVKRVLDDTERQLALESSFPQIRLSRNGKNVIVIMLDRAITGLIPSVMAERPEIAEQFAGFTYYPNTLAYGGATCAGGPPIFGGYEYRPIELSRRRDETVVEKHNESLKVMPAIFEKNGFLVTVSDPPLAGYQWTADLSIYDDYPDIIRFNTAGKMTDDTMEVRASIDAVRNRNFFCYGICRIAPVLIQSTLYNRGMYNAAERAGEKDAIKSPQERHGLHKAEGITDSFMRYYSVLKNLPTITTVFEKGVGNTFLFIANDTTHNGMMLQKPAYEPAAVVDNLDYDIEHPKQVDENGKPYKFTKDVQVIHYHALMASMIQLGKWMDFLRAQGVYDNTRIIIVSDHGHELRLFKRMLFDSGEGWRDVFRFSGLLMVKDFDCSGALVTDHRFMTTADTPTLAFEGLIDDPVNPFTGNPIDSSAKEEPEQYVLNTQIANFEDIADLKSIPGTWIRVRGHNIYDTDQWTILDRMPDGK